MQISSPKKKTLANGFSLVEMLVVIDVIGVLTGLALVAYAGVRDNAISKVNDRNAKAVSLIVMSAIGAGTKEFDGMSTRDEIVTKALEGVQIPGPGNTSSFAVPGVDPAQKPNFIDLLEWDNVSRVLVLKP